MKKLLLISITALMAGSCVSYHVEREIDRGSEIRKMKNTGILFRLPGSSSVTAERFNESLSQWLAGHKKVNKLPIMQNVPAELNVANEEFDYFLQFDTSNDFQYDKAIGLIIQYTQKNRAELQKMMDTNGLDGLIIYEVQSAISPEMEFIDFGSLVLVLDKKYNVVYLDHQFDKYNVDETDPNALKDTLLDKVNDRLIKKLLDFKYIKKL